MVPLPFLSYCPSKGIEHFNPEFFFRHNPHVTTHVTTESLCVSYEFYM